MNCPRYIVWVNTTQFYRADTLAEACEFKHKFGGMIYEPLGMTTAEKVAAEPPPEKVAGTPLRGTY